MADPPAELRVVHRQRGHERRSEPHEADDDDQIECALREQEGARRPQDQEPVRHEPDERAAPSPRAVRCRNRRQQARPRERRERRARSPTTSRTACEDRAANGMLCRTRGRRKIERVRITAPAGRVAPPVIATTPLLPNQTPGVEKPCSASRLAITAKAVPTSTVRVSRATRARPRSGRARQRRRRTR